VRGSWAEFGLAKAGYVAAGCGWFSDRSVCYLASGRPVIAQDTGFGAHLPTGTGLLAFDDADDVVAAVDSLRSDYGRHRRAAREIAESVFDSDRVLGELLACL
jgi:glycosyltransferase involved in cell wall biosynthesis